MSKQASAGGRAAVIDLQERRLGRTVLQTYRNQVDIDDVVPNERRPRVGQLEDDELQREIEANEGIFQPLLVEPHPGRRGKFRIIDGDRRWANSVALVKQGKETYRKIPIEVTDRTLSEEERLKVWIYIQRQRREWDAREKEMVAARLVDLVGRASAAGMLDITVRELDNLVQVSALSERFKNVREPGTAITWARELMGVSKKLLTPSVIDAVVKKVEQKRITNSKDLRKLRAILRDPVAKEHFLKDEADIGSALLRLAPAERQRAPTLTAELEAAIAAMKRVPWAELEDLRGNDELLRRIDEAETLLRSLRRTLSS